MEQQNITLKLEKKLLQQVKIEAAQHQLSISALMVEALQAYLRKKQDYQKFKKRALKNLSHPFKFKIESSYSRDSLYDRS